MKFPVTATREYHGKTLDIDCEQETLALFDDKGQRLAIVSWETLIEHMLSIDEDSRFAHSRVHPRAPLAIKVRCSTPDGKQFDSLTGGIGGGGLFIESSAPLAPGTELKVEFSLPDRPNQKFETRAKVAWTRSKPERYLLFPGMGVQFTEIAPEAQARLIELVEALNRTRATA
ncbi:MAG: PilZ domain-containing protein [Nitrospira sp.]|nr:PilZ domain-containing protein [Nitrospira sp.]MCC7471159.1 PilZ domain-containing protein [Candidatus Nomurabacteria bacterium]HNK13473.1 PilZ domain-containing protein [Nitrospira sp.]